MAETIFTKIVAGDIPCQRVFENEHVFAFLDINPLAEGHTLVIPKRAVARLEDLPAEELAAVTAVLPQLAKRILAATGAAAYNVLLNNGSEAGQEVQHVHFHIIPRKKGDGLGFRWNKKQVTAEELTALAERIAAQG